MAREDFYRWARSQLLKILRGKLPGWSEADREDLAQEAVLRVIHQVESGKKRPQEIHRGYLASAAQSVLVDRVNYNKRHPSEAIPEGFDVVDGSQPDPAALADAKELGQAIQECLKELSEGRRCVVTLWLQGHPMREIDKLIEGRPYKSLENLLRRGREDLRCGLRKRGYALDDDADDIQDSEPPDDPTGSETGLPRPIFLRVKTS